MNLELYYNPEQNLLYIKGPDLNLTMEQGEKLSSILGIKSFDKDKIEYETNYGTEFVCIAMLEELTKKQIVVVESVDFKGLLSPDRVDAPEDLNHIFVYNESESYEPFRIYDSEGNFAFFISINDGYRMTLSTFPFGTALKEYVEEVVLKESADKGINDLE